MEFGVGRIPPSPPEILPFRELLSGFFSPQMSPPDFREDFDFAALCALLLTMFFPSCHPRVYTMHQKRNRLSIFERIISPILGTAIAKIAVKALNQRTIVFKLVAGLEG